MRENKSGKRSNRITLVMINACMFHWTDISKLNSGNVK